MNINYKEKITDCAILCEPISDDDNGLISIGKSHYDCTINLSVYGNKTERMNHWIETYGFFTNMCRFVDRTEALIIAQSANQIKEKHKPFDQLVCEDIF